MFKFQSKIVQKRVSSALHMPTTSSKIIYGSPQSCKSMKTDFVDFWVFTLFGLIQRTYVNVYGKITIESLELVLIYNVYGFLDMRHWWNEYDLPQMVKSIYWKNFKCNGYTIYHSNYFPILSYFAIVLYAEIIFGNYNFIFHYHIHWVLLDHMKCVR